MSRLSPTAEGFRAAFRRPSVTFAEITWRWAVGATASALALFGFVEYLRTLPVNNAELLFLRTRQPVLIGQAIAHILRGSLDRVVLAAILAAIALTGLWMIAAALGRIATVRALLEYFAVRRNALDSPSPAITEDSASGDVATRVPGEVVTAPASPFSSMLRINFLRAAATLAAIVGVEGASIVAGFASSPSHPHPGLAFFLFLPLAVLVCAAWWMLNWFLSLAAVFVVRDAANTLGALSAAATFCRQRTGPVLAVNTWNGLAHFAAFMGATTAVSLPLGLAAVLPGRAVIACILLVSLVYFAIVDWLYMARLAGFVCILETPEALMAPAPLLSPPPRATLAPEHTAIDRDEPILSDLPTPAATG